MSQDQCPSTTGKGGEPARPGRDALAARRRALPVAAGSTGRVAWRSVDEFADSPGFRDFVEREFPAGASELFRDDDRNGEVDGASDDGSNGETRRDFLKLMGASLALAGAATIPGCRRPDHKILSYSREVPEDVIPGKPLFFATSMPLPGGGAEGILVETHEGRPTKIEGNPLHPLNRGKSSIWSQASVLNLYDPDRLKYPELRLPSFTGPREATWDDFKAWAAPHLARYDAVEGRGLAFVVDKKTSPARDAMRDAVLSRWPRAAWVEYDPIENESASRGTALAFGRPMRELYDFTAADVVVSLDRDFLCSATEPRAIEHARAFASRRKVSDAHPNMNRLFVAEPGVSITGASADHRLRVSPSLLPAMLVAIAKDVLGRFVDQPGVGEILAGLPLLDGVSVDRAWVEAAAEDLAAARGRALLLAGPTLSAEMHALAHAVNVVLGGPVRYIAKGGHEGASSSAALASLAASMAAGEVGTIVCINTNPVFDAPADLNFAAAFARVESRITLSVQSSETAAASTWSLNGSHELEAWGDVEATDGTLSPIQPMIAPLYGSWSELELLGYFAVVGGAGDRVWRTWPESAQAEAAATSVPPGYHIVRESWRARLGERDEKVFDRAWRRALHDGLLTGTGSRGERPSLRAASVRDALMSRGGGRLAGAPAAGSLDVVFRVSHVGDGRFANNGWLQELPDAGSRITWDNPALISPRTARRLGLMPGGQSDPGKIYLREQTDGRMATITIDGRRITIPVWILPGMADDTILLTVGYGRRVCGLVGGSSEAQVGTDVYAVRSSAKAWTATAAIERAPGAKLIASTQNHWSLEGRTTILRQIDVTYWSKHTGEGGKFAKGPVHMVDPLYGTEKHMSLAEKLGELSHTPPNISIYDNPFNRGPADPDPTNTDPARLDPRGNPTPPQFSKSPQWGMTIDLSSCNGCGVCTIACQAENNIPIVGRKEVAKGREMQWIRVDRYFTGDLDDPQEVLHQPVACVHCENAPCETVCPVNATVHGPEGINYMVYNRCIGTRYCANNCPYKVRRFNFFDYATVKHNGSYIGEDLIPGGGPENRHLIPPRLRKKIDQISRMQRNPDVTVRSRGVMEKCTYCIQRINAARVECKLNDIDGVPDGFFQTACQQACPSDAIVFGDILDPKSQVSIERENQRSYMLLGYLNTRPRTTHLIAVKNPNPKLRTPVDPLDSHGGGGGHDDHGHTHFIDPAKRTEDGAYAMSLRILTAVGGAGA